MGRPHPILVDLAAGRPPRSDVGDYAVLLRSAREHRMTGLLSTWINDGVLSVPRDAGMQLATYNLGIRAHHHRLWNALSVVTEKLGDIGVEVASFKGVTSEARWYDRIGERPGTDLDLLLSPSQFDRIEDIIALFQPDHALTGVAEMMAGSGYIQHVDLARVEGINVDLHFDLLKILIPSRHKEEVWDRTTEFDNAEHGSFRVVDPESSLIQSLLHLTKDRFSLLYGFVEVVRIVEREELDWDYIDRFVRHEGLEVSVYQALETIFKTLDLPTPATPRVGGWRVSMWRVVWASSTQLQGRWGRTTHHRRQFWIPFLARGRLGEAIGRLRELAFPPQELMDHFHPDVSGPYLWRLIRSRVRRGRGRRQEALDARRLTG